MIEATSIDPYALLGVGIDSEVHEVKHAYYRLAMIVHPDKGGTAADMRMVQSAYEYVMAQVSRVNRTTTQEDLEAAFKKFCDSQVAIEPPPWRDLYDQAFRIEFEAAWNAAERKDFAADPHGYGNIMITSDSSDTKTFERGEMIVYTEPLAATEFADPRHRRFDAGEETDFSIPQASDYRLALAPPEVVSVDIKERTFDDIVAERAAQDAAA